MKLKIAILSVLTAIFANAASIDYLSNNSASYFQNPSQTGKISIEGAFYNPAGTAFLDDGTYINANLQNSMHIDMQERLHLTFYTKRIITHFLGI